MKGLLTIETSKLYYENSYIKEFKAKVTDCAEASDGYLITLDKTAFYPVGGGQPFDTGTIDGAKVTSVKQENGVILHKTAGPVLKGSLVLCEINWKRRFYIMQEHTGEHIVSGIIKKLYGLNNVGFHMGRDFVTIDIDGILAKEQIEEAEYMANEAIYANIPVTAQFVNPEALIGIDFRSKKEFSEDVRIVTVDGYDTCACCGTHVASTGEIGIIKITDFQKYKKGMRIYMLCGFRAFSDYTRKNAGIYKISQLLSAKHDEVSDKTCQLLKENESLKRQLTGLRLMRIAHIASHIPEKETVVCLFEDGFSVDELRKLSAACAEKSEIAAAFTQSGEGYRYAISSQRVDIRGITKELNLRFAGKGGGNANMTGGSVFASEKEIRDFFLENRG